MKLSPLLLALAFAAPLLSSAEAPVIEWQKGKCLGGLRPSRMCTTCETCWYCGHKGRYGPRPENTGTCAVCEAKRAGIAPAAK